ncbi:MAG: patatin-like phospholipase family protein [Myxococcota bacterium]|nr:patatin-like phospholipase family protein [Myxococcota bacterium]
MRRPKLNIELQRAMANAHSYVEWKSAAEALDQYLGLEEWRQDPNSVHYRRDVIEDHIARLQAYRKSGAYATLVDFLPESLYENLADLTAPALYMKAHAGTKYLVNAYFDEAIETIKFLCDVDVPGLSRERKLSRFIAASHNFGRTALMLSGGATLGYYHVGVARALWDEDVLPMVMCGSSMGAIVASAICTRGDHDLTEWFEAITTEDRHALVFLDPQRILDNRSLLDQTVVRRELERGIDDLSFAEAYERTGRILNVTVCPTRRRQKPRLLNYRTAPDVLLIQACLASSAVPLFFPPVTLLKRSASGRAVEYLPGEQWADGSLSSDVPKKRLSRLQNVNHFIVSQTNPHVIPFARAGSGAGVFSRSIKLAGKLARGHGVSVLDAAQELTRGTAIGSLVESAHNFLGQDYGGDINIHPRFKPSLYAKMFSNPSARDMAAFVLEGQRATWPRLEMIRNQTAISRSLHAAMRSLKG